MKTENKTHYTSPILEVDEFKTEQGFAQSNTPYDNGGNLDWN